jgi:aspartate-semialdehyde dehydrogenase
MRPAYFPHRIAFNLIPAIDKFAPDGYTGEEWKLINETRKILEAPDLLISPTTVRVPVFTCHSVAVNVETEDKVSVERARELFGRFPGLKVWVGRIREDLSHPRALNFWVVGDQLRKGAATNAVQIAELLLAT